MCDEADGACDIWELSTPRASKEHRCFGCDETIRKGDVYARTSTLYDGTWAHWKHCLRCDRIVSALFEEAHRQDTFGPIAIDPQLDCGQEWEDPPEDVAALAFMTRDEAQEVLATRSR